MATSSSQLRKFFLIAIIVLLVGVVGAALYWKFVLNRTYAAAEILPADTEILLRLEWHDNSAQNNNLNSLSQSIGGSTTVDAVLLRFIGKTYANSAVNFRNDIAPWLGDQLYVARRSISNAEQQVNIFSVANVASRDSFLARLEKEATNVAPETYKSYTIKTLTGTVPVSYTTLSNYLIIGAKPEMIKTVLDVATGATAPLSKAADYKLIARNVNSSALVSGFLDIAPLFRSGGVVNVGTDLKLDENSHARLGISIAAQEGGFALQAFMPSADKNNAKNNKFRSDIVNILPNNIVGYLGGHDLSGFMRQYLGTLLGIPKILQQNLTTSTIEKKYGVNLENDLYSWMTGEYSVAYMNEGSNDFALIFTVDNPGEVAKKVRNLEKAIAGLISDNATDPAFKNVSFSESRSGETVVRYLPLPGAGSHYLNYAVKDNHLIITTSRDALDAILVPSKTQPTLLNSRVYHITTEPLPKGETAGSLYFNGTFLVRFLKSFGYDFAKFQKHFAGINFAAVNNADGTLFSGYLPIL